MKALAATAALVATAAITLSTACATNVPLGQPIEIAANATHNVAGTPLTIRPTAVMEQHVSGGTGSGHMYTVVLELAAGGAHGRLSYMGQAPTTQQWNGYAITVHSANAYSNPGTVTVSVTRAGRPGGSH